MPVEWRGGGMGVGGGDHDDARIQRVSYANNGDDSIHPLRPTTYRDKKTTAIGTYILVTFRHGWGGCGRGKIINVDFSTGEMDAVVTASQMWTRPR